MDEVRTACMKLWVLIKGDEQAETLLLEMQAAYERLLEDK